MSHGRSVLILYQVEASGAVVRKCVNKQECFYSRTFDAANDQEAIAQAGKILIEDLELYEERWVYRYNQPGKPVQIAGPSYSSATERKASI